MMSQVFASTSQRKHRMSPDLPTNVLCRARTNPTTTTCRGCSPAKERRGDSENSTLLVSTKSRPMNILPTQPCYAERINGLHPARSTYEETHMISRISTTTKSGVDASAGIIIGIPAWVKLKTGPTWQYFVPRLILCRGTMLYLPGAGASPFPLVARSTKFSVLLVENVTCRLYKNGDRKQLGLHFCGIHVHRRGRSFLSSTPIVTGRSSGALSLSPDHDVRGHRSETKIILTVLEKLLRSCTMTTAISPRNLRPRKKSTREDHARRHPIFAPRKTSTSTVPLPPSSPAAR